MVSIDNYGGKLLFRIRGKKRWATIFFLTIFLPVWLLGELAVLLLILVEVAGTFDIELLPAIATPPDQSTPWLFIFVWVLLWTIGGMFWSYVLLWQLAGIQTISADRAGMTFARQIFGHRQEQRYELAQIRGIHLSEEMAKLPIWPRQMEYLGVSGGRLSLETHTGSYLFANGISVNEATMVLTELYSYYVELQPDFVKNLKT